jgi:hypothetical protein
MAASNGIAITPPRNRGTTKRYIGSTAIISMADNWSVARIKPNSEVSAVPARPENKSAVTTGPSSFTRPMVAGLLDILTGIEMRES